MTRWITMFTCSLVAAGIFGSLHPRSPFQASGMGFIGGWIMADAIHKSKKPGKRTYLIVFDTVRPMPPNLSLFPESVSPFNGVWVIKSHEFAVLKIYERLQPHLSEGDQAVVFDVTGRDWALTQTNTCMEWMRSSCLAAQPSQPESGS
jgi:hypothetical protein